MWLFDAVNEHMIDLYYRWGIMEDVDAVNEVLDAFFDVSTVAVKTTWLIVYGISLIGERLYEYYLSIFSELDNTLIGSFT